MKKAELTPEQIAECDALKALFSQHAGMTQSAAAEAWGIGNQSNLSHYLNRRQPLTLEVAAKFAKGLGVPVDDFSPRLARQARAFSRTAESAEIGALDQIDKGASLKRARVMTLAELASAEVLDSYVTLVAVADLAPHTLAGFDVRINTKLKTPTDGALILVKTASGSCELGVCRMTVDGFEVVIGRGVVLDSNRHGLIVLGAATETRRVFPCAH